MVIGGRSLAIAASAALCACAAAADPSSDVGGDARAAPPPDLRGPVPPEGEPAAPACPVAPRVARLAAGNQSTLALLEGDPRVWCWGQCLLWKQYASTDEQLVLVPAPLPGLESEAAVDVCAGGQFGCALLENGAVWCWGRNDTGQLGNGEAGEDVWGMPSPVLGLDHAVQLGCGWEHACARRAEGDVWCWGHPSSFRKPDPFYENAQRLAGPLDEPGPASDLVIGAYHTCAVLEDGRFACSGFATTPAFDLQLTQVPPYRSAKAGFAQTCAIDAAGGSLFCWGPHSPSAAAGLMAIAASASGELAQLTFAGGVGCALTTDGRVLCSQGGKSDWSYAGTAPEVRELPGLARPEWIAAGPGQGSGCSVGRCVQCWGVNHWGGLGDGTTESSDDPVLVRWEP